jgi:8-oxo-dGTP pyrophosphatase MutT (NUDIX family)
MTRLFCVTVYVFNEIGDKCLFINHRKLGCWFPPGGKIDPNELPDDAAIRESLEETGVTIELIGERAPVEGGLIRPYGMQLNEVVPGEREHIDFIYLAVARDNQMPVLNERETLGIEWFDVATICDPSFNTRDCVKTWVKRFVQEMQVNKLSF